MCNINKKVSSIGSLKELVSYYEVSAVFDVHGEVSFKGERAPHVIEVGESVSELRRSLAK